MATYTTKYALGDDVEHFTGIKGKITAVHIRGTNAAYEMSYRNGENLTACNVEEIEINCSDSVPVGFCGSGK